MKYFFGTRKNDGAKIYLSEPTWECGWFWGFGYLGNSREHYHLSAYQQKDRFLKLADGSFKCITERRNIDMCSALMEDYDLNPVLLGKVNLFGQSSRLYTFCELSLTAYTLKEAAEVLGRGGSYMTQNPCTDVIKNVEEVARINTVVLPTIFAQIKKLFEEEKVVDETE